MPENAAVLEARERLRAKLGNVQLGGKGSMRRKRRVTKTQGAEDKKLQLNLRRLGVQPVTGIEEVNIFMKDDTVLNFSNPKVSANVNANTFAVTGTPQDKTIADILSSGGNAISQLDQKTLLSYLSKMGAAQKEAAASVSPNGGEGSTAAKDDKDGDDVDGDIPELVPDFEQVSEEAK